MLIAEKKEIKRYVHFANTFYNRVTGYYTIFNKSFYLTARSLQIYLYLWSKIPPATYNLPDSLGIWTVFTQVSWAFMFAVA